MTAQGAATATRRGDRDALAAARRDAVAAARARSRPRRTVGIVVRDVVITLLGLAGVVVIAWTVLSRLIGLSLVVLLTGSMAPTLPTGSVTVMHDAVPAADLAVGDIIKVQRPGYDLPVTHRIISIGAVTGEVEEPTAGVDPQDPAARQVVLQGDANETADPTPYVISSADRVVFGVPYLGYANRILHMPLVLAGIIGALLLLFIGTSMPSGRNHGRRVAGADAVDAPGEEPHVVPAVGSAPARARRSALMHAADPAPTGDAAAAAAAAAAASPAASATPVPLSRREARAAASAGRARSRRSAHATRAAQTARESKAAHTTRSSRAARPERVADAPRAAHSARAADVPAATRSTRGADEPRPNGAPRAAHSARTADAPRASRAADTRPTRRSSFVPLSAGAVAEEAPAAAPVPAASAAPAVPAAAVPAASAPAPLPADALRPRDRAHRASGRRAR